MARDVEWAAERFAILSRYLKDAGEGGLRRELGNAINDAVRPVTRQIRAGLPRHMPDRYAAALASNLALPVSKLTGANPGVRLRAVSPGRARKLKQLDSGVLEHPLFGNREHWYRQLDGVSAGFFTGPAQDAAPQMREAINAAIDRIEKEITR